MGMMFSFCSHDVKHPKPPISYALDRHPRVGGVLSGAGCQRCHAGVDFRRDDEARYSFGASKLTSDEARRLARGIARLPEFMAQRRGFFPRGGGKRWNPKRPYHVALEDMYVREHWFSIDAICKLNSLPFNATGEKIQQGATWCVYEFAWQMDAILF